MTELKTLKDLPRIQGHPKLYDTIDANDVKQEAIKWVKERQFKALGRNPFTDKEILLDVMTIEDFMEFHNITDEE